MRYRASTSACLCLWLLLIPAASPAATDDVTTEITVLVERIWETGALVADGISVRAVRVVPEVYLLTDFAPVWSDGARVASLREAVDASGRDGLHPGDYHPGALDDLRDVLAGRQQADAARRADLDILATDAALTLARHLFLGKVDPASFDPAWNIGPDLGRTNLSVHLGAVIGRADIGGYLESLRHDHPLYTRMCAALARYREIAVTGGWESLAEGPALRPGDSGPQIAALRRRLAVTHGPLETPSDEEYLDAALDSVVRTAQRGFGLTADGIVGTRTIAALNVPVAERIAQLRINLERSRWVLHDVPDDFLLVNIADFHTLHVVDGELGWMARSQVGKAYRQTPVFQAEMHYLVLNPTWTVPPTILAKDILPRVKKDLGYLDQKNLTVLDHGGQRIDPQTVDWTRYSGTDFPYILRQGPGSDNALGRVKFIFPNPQFVFLHDTPSRSLFAREERTFSSGCIRVEQPLELAQRLLADQPKWTRERIDAVLASGETTTVHLTETLPVLLMYWTAFVPPDGTLHFCRDVYDRDGRVQVALDAEPEASSRTSELLDSWDIGKPPAKR